MYYANYYLRTISFNFLNKPMCVTWELKNQSSFLYILTKKCLKNKTKQNTKQNKKPSTSSGCQSFTVNEIWIPDFGGQPLGYAALQSIFQNEISHDLKVPHINMKQLMSAKPSILMKCLVKEIYDKAGITSIVLWKELDFGQAGIFWINQQGSFSDKKKKKKLWMLLREIGASSSTVSIQ